MLTPTQIDQLVTRIVGRCDPDKVYLFGQVGAKLQFDDI